MTRSLTAAWAELLAVETVVAETGRAFDGEEPFHPLARGLLEEVAMRARELAEGLEVLRDSYVLASRSRTRRCPDCSGSSCGGPGGREGDTLRQ